jgi:hypothetical protein
MHEGIVCLSLSASEGARGALRWRFGSFQQTYTQRAEINPKPESRNPKQARNPKKKRLPNQPMTR